MFDKLKRVGDSMVQKRRKILVVDDEIDVLRSTQMLLDRLGFACVVLPDAQHLVEVVVAEKPDLVMQDIMMPGLDVEELVERLRQSTRTAQIPIVLFSASEDLAERAAALDAAGYLRKPFAEQQLREVLARVLGPLPPPPAPRADPEPAQPLREAHRKAFQAYLHEFRNDLTALGSYAQFLLNSPKIEDPEREAAEEINRLLLELEQRITLLRQQLGE